MESGPLPAHLEALPPELALAPRWCRWRLKRNEQGKKTKSPIGSTKDPKNWKPLADLEHEIDATKGLGFTLTKGVELDDGSRLFCLDLDGCRDPKTGKLAEWAKQVVTDLDRTYSEVTPSGTGLHVWLAVKNPPVGLLRSKVTVHEDRPPNVPATKPVEIQVFGAGAASYCTVTGQHLKGTSREIRRVESLDPLVDRFGLKTSSVELSGELPTGPGEPPDRATIEARVAETRQGRLLLEARWQESAPESANDKSASAAFYGLARRVLQAADGHGAAAVDFLLGTVWAVLGAVDETRDAAKYADRSWVTNEVIRAAQKDPTLEVASMFEALPEPAADEKAESKPESEKKSRLVHLSKFAATVDEEPFLVYGLLPRRGIAQIVGPPSSGKTPFATALAVRIADKTGSKEPFFGFEVDATGPVVYMIGEDAAGLRNRFIAESRERNVALEDLDLHVTTTPGRLLDPEDVKRWDREIREACGREIALLVIDTQIRNFGDGAENKSEDMARFMDHVGRLSERLRCLVLLVHHPTKANPADSRGSGVQTGALDAGFTAQRAPRSKTVVLDSFKAKNWQEPEPFVGELKVHEIGTDSKGRPVTAVVLVPASGPLADSLAVDKALAGIPEGRRGDALAVLEALLQLDGAPTSLRALAESPGVTVGKSAIGEPLEALESNGLIAPGSSVKGRTNRRSWIVTPLGRAVLEEQENRDAELLVILDDLTIDKNDESGDMLE